MSFRLIKQDGKARLGEFTTVHGKIKTPLFMNVGTSGAVKGAISAPDLSKIGCQVLLCNTYHLHVRPGEGIVNKMGGIRKFTAWKKPVLTDSGGFQVFSLAKLRSITEEGVAFSSHMDGAKIFMSPESCMGIQSSLASTIAMAFDECPPSKADYHYIKRSCERTDRWLVRCISEMKRLNALEDTINKKQLLFGIGQGGIYKDLRIEHMQRIVQYNLPGYALGGLAVGESAEEMYDMIEQTEPYMPADRPRYLMGVGTPVNLLESVERGIDFFDCVMPSRNARHGNLFTSIGLLNLNNNKFFDHNEPIDPDCGCPTCKSFSRAYVRHLFKARELLAMRLCVIHNLYFYNSLMEKIRQAIADGNYSAFKKEMVERLSARV